METPKSETTQTILKKNNLNMSLKGKVLKSYSRKKKVEKKPIEGRKYAQIAPQSITLKAESCGFTELHEDISRVLSQEVSYRLREIVHRCSIHLRQSKCTKLLPEHVNEVLQWADIFSPYGHQDENPTFIPIDGTDLYFLDDQELNLEEIAFEETPITQNVPYITGSWRLPDECDATQEKTENEQEMAIKGSPTSMDELKPKEEVLTMEDQTNDS